MISKRSTDLTSLREGQGSKSRNDKINKAMKMERSQEKPIKEKSLEAAVALILGNDGSNLPFGRSTSLRGPLGGGGRRSSSKRQGGGLPRSASSRPSRVTGDPLLPPPHLLLNQDKENENIESKQHQFVLVHGGGFGAWCWYKTISLLKDSGFKVNAIDLTGSGVHAFDTNNIKTLSQYAKPLTTFLQSLGTDEKVILVGHDLGGACISFAMEAFPSKIAKAVFVSAAMLANAQTTLQMFTNQEGTSSDSLMRKAQIFQYANGKDQAPTAIDFDKSLVDSLFFNQSPGKDIALASVSMRPVPFAPVLEKLSLTQDNYGSVRRFYIQTTDDNAFPLSLQQSMCSLDPPENVFQIKASDHCPFFSKPQALHKLFVQISSL